jgi:hypothetical protein
MTNRRIKILAPKTMIEGWRIWVLAGNAWKELSQVNGDGHGAAFASAFDSEAKAIQAARRYYRGAGA